MSTLRKHCVIVVIMILLAPDLLNGQDQKKGLITNKPEAFQGYTLFAPHGSTTTFLIDMEGRTVQAWKSDYEPGHAAYLLENGHLLRTGGAPHQERAFNGGGSGGRVQEFDWEGELLWDFEYASEDHLLHHDIERLPNGNILMIAWERKSARDAVDGGRNPERLSKDGLWSDQIIEVKPTGKTTGEIVWEWHVWDHLIQDHDPKQANYGKVKDHPERIDLNPMDRDWTANISNEEREKLEALGYIGATTRRNKQEANPDWIHTNSIDYHAGLDQIVVSVLGFSEIWIIDHSTTTEEARGHSGGKCGKGGDLLYRWGNPQACDRGTPADQQLFAQHDAHWIPEGLEGSGNLLVFNNGRGRPGGNYSSVDEIVTPVKRNGTYACKGEEPFGPLRAGWQYTAPVKEDFWSGHISGAQRLPNGNTLICAGASGRFFEITADKDVVWEYVNPVVGMKGPPGQDRGGPNARGMGRGGAGADRPGRDRPGTDQPGADRPRGERPGGDRQGGDRPGGDRPGRDGRGPGRPGMGPPPGMGGAGPDEGPGGGGPGSDDQGGPQKGGGMENNVFRAYRYGPDFPGLAGKELKPGKTVEALLPPPLTPPPIMPPGPDEAGEEGFEILDMESIKEIVPRGAKLEKLAGDMQFTEGPVWMTRGSYLLFSDIPADEIKKWQEGKVTTFRKPSHHTNGNLLDEQGRLVSCEHGSRSVTRTLKDGTRETLVGLYQGKRFNSPNDLAIRSDGMIWFTDPPYGLGKDQSKRELEANHVFRFDPATGDLAIAAKDFDRPNGICLSPDEKRLYIADSGKPAHIRLFRIEEDDSLTGGEVFCKIDPGSPDGITCDGAGRLFSSAGDGVHIFLPSGKLVGKIKVPERPSNLCFGGKEGSTLFITARTSLYAIPLKAGR